MISGQDSFPKGYKTFQIQPKKASKIYTYLAIVIILAMVLMYVNTTLAHWRGVSNQKQQEIDDLIKDLDSTKLELEEVHRTLELKEKPTPRIETVETEGELEIEKGLPEVQPTEIEGAEKEGELEIKGEIISIYEFYSPPPGMNDLYDGLRGGYTEIYGGSYRDINIFKTMIVLHDSGQIKLNGDRYREQYGKEPDKVAEDKLEAMIKRLNGYESLEGKEKIPRLSEVIRLENLKVINNFVQTEIEYISGEDYPRFPLETFSLRNGDSEDKSMLLSALLEIEGYETGLLTIFDAENNFYHNALAVKDEGGWIRNKLMFKGYEKEGLIWILLDPQPNTMFGELPDWTKQYRSVSGAIEIPSTKYVFTVVDEEMLQALVLEEYGTLSEEEKITTVSSDIEKTTTINTLTVSDGVGVVIPINVEIKQGNGRLLMNIDDTIYFADTQSSMTIALGVAKSMTGAKLEDKDIIIWVENPYGDTIALYGDSAGSSIAVALVANLWGKNIKDGVLLTGSINADGSIGPVDGIPVKAKAASEIGVKTLLVPQGQGLNKEGMDVIEVPDIGKALSHMLE